MESLRTYGNPPYSAAVIHGGPGAAGDMAPVAIELSREWGVLEPLQMSPSIDGQVLELLAILLQNAALPVTLIGHSWGAWLGFILSARHPGMLIECPVVAIHGDYDTHPSHGVAEPLSRIITNFQIILLKNCGHYPWKEQYARDSFYSVLKHELK